MNPGPFFKLAGGKRKLVSELVKYIPSSFNTYYEPFVGGGALFWHLSGLKPRAVLSDTNPDMIAAYLAVRDNVEELIKVLSRYPRDKDFYLELRARTSINDGNVIRGARFIYLLKCGFNGLWRTNKAGLYNVPFGDNNGTICDAELLRWCSMRLKNVTIICTDFTHVLGKAVANDLVYFDPPYVPLNPTSNFTNYTVNGFDLEDQIRLRKTAEMLKNRGVHVILSNSSSPIVEKLYKGFDIQQIEAKRSINSKGDKRGPIKEVIIT
jgi:DNA adenine methylase